jgi:hypothetical protein
VHPDSAESAAKNESALRQRFVVTTQKVNFSPPHSPR